jgi:hypothetical protein
MSSKQSDPPLLPVYEDGNLWNSRCPKCKQRLKIQLLGIGGGFEWACACGPLVRLDILSD